jgi:RimJ/RimL family protein N-acetyltransferase
MVMIKLCKAVDDLYFEKFYQMKCLKNNIFFSGFLEAPNKEQLFSNFLTKINSNEYELFFLLNNDSVVSHSQIKYLENSSCEMSYASLITGHGYGNRVVFETINYCFSTNIIKIVLYIANINTFSINIAEKNGFIKSNRFEMRCLLSLKEDIRYDEWILKK